MTGRVATRRTGVVRRAVLLGAAFVIASGAAYPQSKGDPGRGAAKAGGCEACHGTAERAPLPGMPTLAGQQEEFLVLQMVLLREGLRDVPRMAGLLKGFTDADLADVAAYLTRQKALAGDSTRDAKLHARGAELAKNLGCGSCHLASFLGQQHVPRIANQREDYIAASLTAYRESKRTGVDTSMNAAMYGVSDADIRALAHFLAHQ